MSTVVNLTKQGPAYDTSNDTIVIVKNLETIPGGRSLNVTDFAPDVIPAGHLIIKETSTGDFKPMPVVAEAYGTLPVGHTYEGILISTIRKDRAFAGIMIRGSVNKEASFYNIASVLVAAKAALPLIRFTQD